MVGAFSSYLTDSCTTTVEPPVTGYHRTSGSPSTSQFTFVHLTIHTYVPARLPLLTSNAFLRSAYLKFLLPMYVELTWHELSYGLSSPLYFTCIRHIQTAFRFLIRLQTVYIQPQLCLDASLYWLLIGHVLWVTSSASFSVVCFVTHVVVHAE